MGRDKKGHIVGGIIFTAIYLAVIYWFQDTKIWHNYFYQPSRLYIVYHLLRVVFIFYLGCVFYAMGNVVIGLINRKLKEDIALTGLERFVITSYTGSAVLLILMFIIGLMKGYYTIVAVMITAPLVYLSYPDVRGLVLKIKGFRNGEVLKGIKAEGREYSLVVAVIAVLMVFQIFYLFVSKGLMPDLLTNDTVGGYVPYYQKVIDSHTNWINRFWLQYFYSKGAGLFFLASLLTDVQSTQLVSFYFYLLAGLTMTVLIGKFIKQQGMLWLLLALFIAFSSSLTLNEVGIIVVEFQKPHPTVASFIFFTVFLSTLLIRDSKIPKRLILAVLTIIIFSTIIMSPVSTAFLLTFFVLMLVLSYLLDNSYDKFALKVGLVTIVVAFIGILSFNLFTFGVAEMTPMSFFFTIQD